MKPRLEDGGVSEQKNTQALQQLAVHWRFKWNAAEGEWERG